jgi:hypothetical protein
VDLEVLGPLSGDVVNDILLSAGRVEGSGEGVLLARDPTLAGIVDLGGVAGGRGDVCGALELDEGGAEEKAFDVKRRKGNQILIRWLTRVRAWDRQDGVADLLNVNGLGEAGLLRVVAFEVDAGWDVGDAVGRRRRMMT